VINKTTTSGVRIKSHVKAGEPGMLNHNQAAKGLRVKCRVKAGQIGLNHNQAARGVRIKSGVKAGDVKVGTGRPG
jgi:hypothetical protein